MASEKIEVFLIRPICGNAGTFAANTIPKLDKKYADELIEKKLARKPKKADREKAEKIKSPIIDTKDQKLPNRKDGSGADGGDRDKAD